MKLRVVRFQIGEDAYESLITNLDPSEFNSEALKQVYHLRWGIETSFRELKYALGLMSFHSKNKTLIYQEIYARLIMYNFSMLIAMAIKPDKPNAVYAYQINYTRAFGLCLAFFNDVTIQIDRMIEKYILPIRPDRKDKRKLRTKAFSGFLYRVA